MGECQQRPGLSQWEWSSYSSFLKGHSCLPFPSSMCGNLASCCVCRATVCDHDTLHGCKNIMSIFWPAQGGFETAAWIASFCEWLGLALATLKLNCFSPLNDLLCLWPGFCVHWASAVLHPEAAPCWCCAEHRVHVSVIPGEAWKAAWILEDGRCCNKCELIMLLLKITGAKLKRKNSSYSALPQGGNGHEELGNPSVSSLSLDYI